MHKKKRKAFLTWHREKVESAAIFDFQKELSAYLKSDVQVLKGACLTFVKEMKELTGVNPLTQCVTIASLASHVWRKLFLEEDLIALELKNGWWKNQLNQSNEAIEWLEFENSKLGGMGRIRHKRNSLNGEVKVLTPAQDYFVDGFNAETRTVSLSRMQAVFSQQCGVKRNAHPDQTVDEVYEAMQRKTLMLRAVGYAVIEKWGCEYKEDKKTNAELKAFLNNHEAIPPLQPRDGFFGGRTGATTLYAKAEPDKEILYQDFTSLYPWVNKYCKYPVGFPEAHLNASNQDIHSYFGVLLIDVLAPERLFHPVLPVREGGK